MINSLLNLLGQDNDVLVQEWLGDFQKLKAYLENKALVLKHLQPLALNISHATQTSAITPLNALKMELIVLEARAGFAGVTQSPLKVLPIEQFLKLMQDGHVIDDYGVGLQHGELTHRIHWYSIVTAFDCGELKLTHPPIEVYKAINLAHFAQRPDGATVWAELFDRSITASADHYCDGGTLNRDLLEADPNWDRLNVGLAERHPSYQRPDTRGLEPISQALSELRRIRISEVELVATPAEKIASSWLDYGFPPPSAVKAFKASQIT